ncbi:MAG: ATP-binding protein [Marmoricola sp.]
MGRLRRRFARLSSQIFLGQLVILVATVVIGFGLFVRTERTHLDQQFETRAATIAESTAGVPRIRQCLASPDRGCAAAVQRIATAIEKDTGASYVVVIDMDRVRHSHPDPNLVGKRVEEPLAVTDGAVHTGIDDGSMGRSANGKAPLFGPGGRLVGEVSAGIRESSVQSALWAELPSYAVWFAIALALGAVASWVLSRILKRRTFGLELDDIALLLQEREATLHGIREGVVAVDSAGRISMINDPGRELLDLDTSVVGRRLEEVLEEVVAPGRLRDVLLGADPRPDRFVLTDDHALVVNRMPVILAGRPHGAVITLRDRTDIAALIRERDGERGLIESLRAQHHEFANRMHTVSGMLELGMVEEALDYLLEVRGSVAALDDSLRETIAAPQVVGLLLGKAAEAGERGIDLVIDPATWLSESPGKIQVLTSVVGNLVDNAMDAVAALPAPRRVVLGIVEAAGEITVEVTDNGPGVPPELVPEIFQHGYTTKSRPDGEPRGLGLALVHRLVSRVHGSIDVTTASSGRGARFVVRIPQEARLVPTAATETRR